MFNTDFELASNNSTNESIAFVVAEITVPVIASSMVKITFVLTEITF